MADGLLVGAVLVVLAVVWSVPVWWLAFWWRDRTVARIERRRDAELDRLRDEGKGTE